MVLPALKCTTALCAMVFLSGNSAAGEEVFAFLDPAAIRAAYEEARKDWTPAPPVLAKAVVTAEDKNFFERSASLSTLTRSVGFWYPKGRSDPSFPLAVAVGQALNHDEILDWFLHEIFLGQSCFGIDGASMAYFGKAAEDLSLQEAGYLAALPQAPARLHPERNAERATARRNFVLNAMATEGVVSAAEAKAAMEAPLGTRVPLGTCDNVQK